MRCIETNELVGQFSNGKTINYNMRCIETLFLLPWKLKWIKINYNMRCIETNDRIAVRNILRLDKLQHEMY